MPTSKEYPYTLEKSNGGNYWKLPTPSKKQIEFLNKKELIGKINASKIKHSTHGLNNRLPASLKLIRFIRAKGLEVNGTMKRFEAIDLIESLGFSVDMNDMIIKDE